MSRIRGLIPASVKMFSGSAERSVKVLAKLSSPLAVAPPRLLSGFLDASDFLSIDDDSFVPAG